MVHKHEKGSGSVAKRLLGLCLALVMLCGVFVPTFASVAGGEEPTQPQQETVGGTDEKQTGEGQQTGGEEQGTPVDTENNGGTGNDSGNDGNADAAKDGEGDANANGDGNTNGDGSTGEANAPANDLPKAETPVVSAVAPQASTYTVEEGATITLSGKNGSNHSWTFDHEEFATVTDGQQNATVTGVKAGTVTITHKYSSSDKERTETFTVKVAKVQTVKVYVYVSGKYLGGQPWTDEMFELLGIDKSTLDSNQYFPAGEIYIPQSIIDSLPNRTTEGGPMVTQDATWDTLIPYIKQLDPSHLIGVYSRNNKNTVGSYADYIARSVNGKWGEGVSAFFHWHYSNCHPTDDKHHYGFEDQNVNYHLDLKFTANKITFITGNNGITTGDARDGTTVEDRPYITGVKIEQPKEVTPPEGYWVEGYYKDADFSERWNGIDTPLTEDQKVYIRIVEKEHAFINYKVATGADTGSVKPTEESFNVDIDTPDGSTAAPTTGYVFEGWYTDADCTATNKVSSNAKFVPTAPAGGWKSGETYTYYAKFVPATTTVTIEKQVTGLLGDKSKEFTFTCTYTDKDGNPKTENNIKLSDGKTYTINDVLIGKDVTVTETNADGYKTSYKIGTAEPEDITSNRTVTTTVTGETTITFTNYKDANPDTGIFLDSMPYIMALVIVAGGAAVFFLRRRKKSED